MKSLFIFLMLLISFNTLAANKVICIATRTVQVGQGDIPTDARLDFTLEKNGNQSVLTNLEGHIFVKNVYEEGFGLDTSNSYMGFFKIKSLKATPDYRPRKYVGFAQFNHFDATYTTGLESGMWGYLAANVDVNEVEFEAYYVFQAGDHMGGTVLFNCFTHHKDDN